jgi:hypothetical protein
MAICAFAAIRPFRALCFSDGVNPFEKALFIVAFNKESFLAGPLSDFHSHGVVFLGGPYVSCLSQREDFDC